MRIALTSCDMLLQAKNVSATCLKIFDFESWGQGERVGEVFSCMFFPDYLNLTF